MVIPIIKLSIASKVFSTCCQQFIHDCVKYSRNIRKSKHLASTSLKIFPHNVINQRFAQKVWDWIFTKLLKKKGKTQFYCESNTYIIVCVLSQQKISTENISKILIHNEPIAHAKSIKTHIVNKQKKNVVQTCGDHILNHRPKHISSHHLYSLSLFIYGMYIEHLLL